MPEDITKRMAVTFGTGLPLGVHGRFKHDGQWWIAFPASKNARILAGIDRMIGIFAGIQSEMLRLINDHPEDAARVVKIADSVAKAYRLRDELVVEKTEAKTM